MYFFLILFFLSLTAIIFMIGRKFFILNNIEGQHINTEGDNFLSEMVDSDKLKKNIIVYGKKTLHTIVWVALRIYIISLNFINKKRKDIILKLKNRFNKNYKESSQEKKEISGYMKVISEYRQKIRRIKHKIEVEEGIHKDL